MFVPDSVTLVFISDRTQGRSQSKAAVTDQSGLQDGRGGRLWQDKGKMDPSQLSLLLFIHLRRRRSLSPSSFPHLCPLLHCFTFKILSPSFSPDSSSPPRHYLHAHLFPSSLPPSLRQSSIFHLFSTLSFPLLTLSQIDFQLCVECLEASIFPNLTPIQPM